MAVSTHSTVTGTFNQSQVVRVTVAGDPRMAVDIPAANATVYPTFTIAGWAADLGTATGPGVDAVHVWAYPNPGSGTPAVFVGAAELNGARPDVGAVFGHQFTDAGFGLTATLPLGVHRTIQWTRIAAAGAGKIAGATPITFERYRAAPVR